MAKEIGSGAVRSFGYNQMREAEAQREKEARLRKSQGGLGASLMALGNDPEAGGIGEREKLKAIGLAASVDTGPIGQIASAIGKFKQMGAIEKKREAERGRKDIMSKMLLGGATDLSLDEIGELEGQNPEFVQKIVDYKRSEARREKLEGREDEKWDAWKDEQERLKERHGWQEKREDIAGKAANTRWEIDQEELKDAQQLTPEEHFRDNWDQYKGILEQYKDADGNSLIPEGAENLYKNSYQNYQDLVNTKILPHAKNEAVAKRIYAAYKDLWPAHIKNHQDVMDMEYVPQAVLKAMVVQNDTTRKMPAVQQYNKRIAWKRKEYHESIRRARPRVKMYFAGMAERYVKSMIPQGAKKIEELPKEIQDLFEPDPTTGTLSLKAEEGVREKAVDVLMATEFFQESGSQDQFNSLMAYETAGPQGELQRLSGDRNALIGQNHNLLQGFQRFDNWDAANNQVERSTIGAVYEGPNGGLYEVQMRGDEKVGVPMDDKEKADEFRNYSMGMNHPFFTPQETELNNVLKDMQALLGSNVPTNTNSSKIDALTDRAMKLILGISDPSVQEKWKEKFNNIKPQAFAEGGYVTEPTNAIVGEGGEDEYVIPESKMGAALENYESGARGDAVVPDGVPSGQGLRIGEYGDTGSAGESGESGSVLEDRPGGWNLEEVVKGNAGEQQFSNQGGNTPFPGFLFNVDPQYGVSNADGNYTPQELKDANWSNAGWIPRIGMWAAEGLGNTDAGEWVAPTLQGTAGALATLQTRDFIKKGWGSGKPGKELDSLLDEAVKEYEAKYEADVKEDSSKKLSDAEKSKKVGSVKDEFLDKKAKQYGLKDEFGQGKKWTPERIKHFKHKMNSTFLRRWGSAIKPAHFKHGKNLKSHRDGNTPDADDTESGKKKFLKGAGGVATYAAAGLLTVDAIQSMRQIVNAVPDKEKPKAVQHARDIQMIKMMDVYRESNTTKAQAWREFLKPKK